MVKKKKQIIITKHVLVPEHIKLNQKEKAAILEHYNITTKELPKILKSDPLVEKLKANVDDVIKIKRKSHTAGETIFYRAVADE